MIELLAPSGNINQLRAAVFCGADAVYLGLENFNARKKADNFTLKNLGEAVDFCHLHGVKVYVAVNTSVKDKELEQVKAVIIGATEAGVDAFIATDLGVVSAIKQFSDVPVHLSTQAGISNFEGALYAKKLGADRVVLARETKLEDVIAISKIDVLEIECFVHGALCVAFSGKCLFSSLINGGSGNRGLCLQPCRLNYTCGKNSGYLLSTSDLCLLDKLRELTDAGVVSFKIEGRARSVEYVAQTVSVYRAAIDNNFKFDASDFDRLKAVFNRGDYTKGYNFGETTASLMSTKLQANSGLEIGVVERLDTQKNRFFVKTKYDFKSGDGFKLLLDGEEVGGGQAVVLDITDLGFWLSGSARVGAKINLTKQSSLSGELSYLEKLLAVDFVFDITDDGRASVKATYNGAVGYACSEVLEQAKTAPTSCDDVNLSLKKCGGTNFLANNVIVGELGNRFIAKSTLNNLRREALASLTKELLNRYDSQKITAKNKITITSTFDFPQLDSDLIAIELENDGYLTETIKNKHVVLIYSPSNYDVKLAKAFLKKAKRLKPTAEVFFKPTANANGRDITLFKSILDEVNFDGIFADNYYAVQLAAERNLAVFAGLGLNIFNAKSLQSIQNLKYYLASAELNLGELKNFKSPFVFSYGYAPLMRLSHCPVQLNLGGNCANCKYTKPLCYCDKNNYNFKVAREKASNCYFTLYNSVKTDISNKFDKIRFNCFISMLQLSLDEAERALDCYFNTKPSGEKAFTYGHLFRGVE